MTESEIKAAEEQAIGDYKKTLRRGKPPSTVAVFRAAFRAGVAWAEQRHTAGREDPRDVWDGGDGED